MMSVRQGPRVAASAERVAMGCAPREATCEGQGTSGMVVFATEVSP